MQLACECVVEHKVDIIDFHMFYNYDLKDSMVVPGASTSTSTGSSSSSCSCGAIING